MPSPPRLLPGASPCTDWLGDVVVHDDDGFAPTGPDAEAEGLLEASVPGVHTAGDVRAESIKRCATAIGQGAAIVRFVHKLSDRGSDAARGERRRALRWVDGVRRAVAVRLL